MHHKQRGYMNTVHISENDIISYIISTDIIDDDTEDSFQRIHCLQWLP